MPLIACPGCGHPVASVAPECPRCTRLAPGRSASPAGAGAELGRRQLRTALAGMAGLVLAALAGGAWLIRSGGAPAGTRPGAPHYSTRQAKEFTGERELAAIHGDQQRRRAASGRYDRDVSAAPRRDPAFFAFSISRADRDRLCIEATPIPGSGEEVGPMSMDESGTVHRTAGCDVRVDREAKLRAADRLLTEAYQLGLRHREAHGRWDADLLQREYLAPSPFYTVSVSRATADEVCMEAEPRPGAGAGLPPRSMDHTGWLYAGPGCVEEPGS